MNMDLAVPRENQLTPQEEVQKAIDWCDGVAKRADEIVKEDLHSGIQHLQFAKMLKLRQEQTRMDDLKKSVEVAILELKRSIGKSLLDMSKKNNQHDDGISLEDLGISKTESHRYQAMARAPEYVWNRAINESGVPSQKRVFAEIKRYTKLREMLTEVKGSVKDLQKHFVAGRDPKLLKEELTRSDKIESDPKYGLSDDKKDVSYDYVGSTEKKDNTPKNDVDLRDGDGVKVDLTRLISRVEELVPVAADIHDEVMNAVDGDRIVPDEQKARMVKVTKQVADPMSLIEDRMQNM